MDPLEIASRGKIPASLARVLLDGISQQDLEMLLAEQMDVPPTDPRVPIARMNAVGGLRACGYIVEGGRNGRFLPYKIVGWEEKRYPRTADQWTGRPREILDYVERLPRPTYDQLAHALAKRRSDYLIHENSPGYVLAYELARDTGFVWNGVLIVRKHPNLPRFRLFALDAKPDDVVFVAKQISLASLGPVFVINVDPRERLAYREAVKGSWGKRKEAVYHTDDIANSPERFLNTRGMSQLRKNERETYLYDTYQPAMEERVVRTWKEHLESRHRQLAITRDFVGIKLGNRVMHFWGVRQSQPVAAYVVDRLPNRTDAVIDVLNKSLNYRTMPAGQPGTSDWLLVNVCRHLSQQGIKYLLAGGLDGGGDGLEPHKRRFTDHIEESLSFYPYIEHLTREELFV